MDQEQLRHKVKIINEEWGGIFAPYEVFYIEAIHHVSLSAFNAFHRYEQAILNELSDEAIVSALQEALTHTAALARFFWPSRDKITTKERGEKLRVSFELSEQSPLKNKELRNALEHFDERLDAFLLEEHAGFFYPQSLVAPAVLFTEQVNHVFRLVDPLAEEFILLGKKYSFKGMREEVEAILKRVQQMNQEGGRLTG